MPGPGCGHTPGGVSLPVITPSSGCAPPGWMRSAGASAAPPSPPRGPGPLPCAPLTVCLLLSQQELRGRGRPQGSGCPRSGALPGTQQAWRKLAGEAAAGPRMGHRTCALATCSGRVQDVVRPVVGRAQLPSELVCSRS